MCSGSDGGQSHKHQDKTGQDRTGQDEQKQLDVSKAQQLLSLKTVWSPQSSMPERAKDQGGEVAKVLAPRFTHCRNANGQTVEMQPQYKFT